MNMVPSQLGGGALAVKPAALNQPERDLSHSHVPILQQYLRVALRWRYVVLGILGACMVAGLIATLLMTPKYTAVSTIEISRESASVIGIQGVEREASIADQEFYQTQYGLLESRSLAERIASQLRLVDDPGFFELFGVSSDEPAFRLTNGRFPASGREARLRAAGDILLDNVSIEPTRLSRLVDVRFVSPSPEFSARVANAWAENFIESNLERKLQSTSYGRRLVERQLADAKERLDESQRQLVAYASNQQIINLPSGDRETGGERPIVVDNLTALNSALSEATADRIQAEARYRQVGSGGASREALLNSAINGLRQRRAELAAEYERLMQQFEPAYPTAVAVQSQIGELDQAIAREENRVASSYQADYRQALARENALQARVDSLKSEFLDLRRRSIQYNIFEQEVHTNRVLYDALLQRYKEIGVAGGVGVNNVAVVDPADVPEKPSSPSLLINLAASLILGLGLGALAAFALEQLDDAITDPTEFERRIGVPLLGTVPVVKEEAPKDALADRKSELFDAYLAVQASLSFSTDRGIPRSFAITSTRPAEGKSTTALALATTLARSNRRVILVDGDMRSPSVHQFAGVGHAGGLSNYLSGQQDDLRGLTFEMPALGFDALSAGPIPPNAAELLTGDRLARLIAYLLGTYDHVVIDSPPVLGLADAPLIASQVEAVIYAVESHGIRSRMVKNALSRLHATNANVIGGVLTKFEPRKASYAYGYDYGYDYGRRAEEETA